MTGVTHSNPVTQAGFTMIPNTVMLRGDLSVGAKLLYGYMKHLAWRNGDDPVSPPREAIAGDLGLNATTVTKYMRELQTAAVCEGGGEEEARLVESKRRGQGHPNVYVVNDPEVRKGDSPSLESGDSAFPARAVPSSSSKTSAKTRELEPKSGSSSLVERTEKPPKLVKINGHDLAFDVLADETGAIDANAAREVAIALNGSKTKNLTGIRQLAWDELTDGARAAYRETPELWENYLASAIPDRAAVYRAGMPPGNMLTPLALAKWWGRVEGLRPGGRMLTEEEFAAVVESASGD